MLKEPSAVCKCECSDSVFDWLSIFWSVILECSVETRPESVHCSLVVVSELRHPCLPDPCWAGKPLSLAPLSVCPYPPISASSSYSPLVLSPASFWDWFFQCLPSLLEQRHFGTGSEMDCPFEIYLRNSCN